MKWYGYLHKNGSVHIKRYVDRQDLIEASESPFVYAVFGPYEVDSRAEAEQLIKKEMEERMMGGGKL